MAKTRGTSQPDLVSPAPDTPARTIDPGADPDWFDTDNEAESALSALSSEMGGEANRLTVHVFKRRADRLGIARCKRFALEDFDLDRIPEMFGGGEYAIRVTDEKGEVRLKRRVNFDPEIFPNPGARAELAAPSAVPVGPGSEVAELRRQLHDSTLRHQAFVEALLSKALLAPPPPPVNTLKETLETLRALMPLVGASQQSPAKEVADAIKMGLELARDAGGGEERGEDTMTKIIGMLVPLLERNLGAGRPATITPIGPRALPATGPNHPAGPRVDPSASATPPAAPPDLPPEWQGFAFLRAHMGTITNYARMNVTPDLVGSLIFQLVPVVYLPDLARFVHLDPDTRQKVLRALDAKLEPFLPYLQEVAASIAEDMETDRADPGTAS